MQSLDQAYGAMQAGDASAGLRFYRLLADATLFLLLEREAEGERVDPRVFDLPDGPVLLAYDSEERLAVFGQGPQSGAGLPYAALPGRLIAQQMLGQGLSLGLNFGTGAASEVLLPPEALRWLCEMLEAAPVEVEATPVQFFAPKGLPEALSDALTFTLGGAAGLARAALLSGVRYSDGRLGHMLAVIDAAPGAEEALARALSEALVFSGLEAGELDVTFLSSGDAAVVELARVAIVFEVPELVAQAAVERAAPGMDGKPPRLR
ncbi:SseB family protein [Cypionkella psychrotolerans]|uniref:SseB family protein n=1 Tax=Cypionkella psychrotolerans TaxID=1678131 RepID=UPI0006B537AA|nr:SseB family protein [Cypionkella psychrotolerans]